MTFLFRLAACASSRMHSVDSIDAALTRKTTASAASIARSSSCSQLAAGGMLRSSSQTSLPCDARASRRRTASSRSLCEYETNAS